MYSWNCNGRVYQHLAVTQHDAGADVQQRALIAEAALREPAKQSKTQAMTLKMIEAATKQRRIVNAQVCSVYESRAFDR